LIISFIINYILVLKKMSKPQKLTRTELIKICSQNGLSPKITRGPRRGSYKSRTELLRTTSPFRQKRRARVAREKEQSYENSESDKDSDSESDKDSDSDSEEDAASFLKRITRAMGEADMSKKGTDGLSSKKSRKLKKRSPRKSLKKSLKKSPKMPKKHLSKNMDKLVVLEAQLSALRGSLRPDQIDPLSMQRLEEISDELESLRKEASRS
jgi:hypothetical protein